MVRYSLLVRYLHCSLDMPPLDPRCVCCCQLMGSLEEVHMPQNGINHPGVTALATAVQHNAGLRVLNLNDNTFTKKGAIAMAQVTARWWRYYAPMMRSM